MDLVTPVRKQIELAKKHGLKTKFLLQYDALIDSTYTDMLFGLNDEMIEIGVWFEVSAAALRKGGYQVGRQVPVDWHAHCGFRSVIPGSGARKTYRHPVLRFSGKIWLLSALIRRLGI